MISLLGLVWVALIIFALRRPSHTTDINRPGATVPQPPVAFRGRVAGVTAAAWLLNTLGLYCLAAISDMPIYARHLAGIFVAVPLLAALAIARVPPVRWQKALLLTLAGLWMLSALNLRHLPQHRKDDYRTAARMASEDIASKKTVWWAASPHAARFYGLTLSEGASAVGAAMLTVSPAAGSLTETSLPDKIYLSKKDLFDRQREIQRRIEQSSYRLCAVLPGFRVYQKAATVERAP